MSRWCFYNLVNVAKQLKEFPKSISERSFQAEMLHVESPDRNPRQNDKPCVQRENLDKVAPVNFEINDTMCSPASSSFWNSFLDCQARLIGWEEGINLNPLDVWSVSRSFCSACFAI